MALVLIVLAVAVIGDIISGAIGLASAPTTSQVSTAISFDSVANSANINFTNQQTMVTVQVTAAHEILIVSQTNDVGTTISSVTDSQGNAFTQQMNFGTSGLSGLGVFTTFPSVGPDTVTTTLAANPGQTVVLVSLYKNINSVGAVGSLDGGGAPSTTGKVITNTTISGSWLIGFAGLTDPFNNTNTIIANAPFIQRIDKPGALTEQALQDTNQTFLNAQLIPFTPSWTFSRPFELGTVEITPFRQEPNQFSQCGQLGQSCHTQIATKATGILTQNFAMHAGTAYCTGVTSHALNLTRTSIIKVGAIYSIDSRNVTGQVFTVLIQVNNAAPTTTLSTGTCTANLFFIAENLYAPVTSINGKGFSVAFAVAFSGVSAGTWWGSISVTPITTNVAIDNLGNNGSANVPGSSIYLEQGT